MFSPILYPSLLSQSNKYKFEKQDCINGKRRTYKKINQS